MTEHITDDDLEVYAIAPSLSLAPEEIAEHLAICGPCRGRLQTIDEIGAAFSNAEVWLASELMRTRSQRFEAARAEYERIAEEDAAAEELLEPLLKSPLRFRAIEIDDVRFHTGAVVRKLCVAAHARHEKQPQFSLHVASTACRIALHMPKGGSERRSVLGLAVRERANALRYLGRFAEGLKSLDDAEKLFDQSPGTDPFDLAVCALLRATIYMKSERLAEGATVARKAAEVLHEYGDSQRELSSLMVEACCLALGGDTANAATAFGRVIDIARSTGEREMLARALQNMAVTHLTAGRSSEAASLIIEAMAIFDEIGLATERARSMWKLATVHSVEGRLSQSATQLEDARTELLRLQLLNDAALVTLEWAEVRLALSMPEGVSEACESIVLEFESEGMHRSASVALAYLHETLRSGLATEAIIREVRTYLEELPSRPDLIFEPGSRKPSLPVS